MYTSWMSASATATPAGIVYFPRFFALFHGRDGDMVSGPARAAL
jgi:hypothetical protein